MPIGRGKEAIFNNGAAWICHPAPQTIQVVHDSSPGPLRNREMELSI